MNTQVAKVRERFFKTLKLTGQDIYPGSEGIFRFTPDIASKILDVRAVDNSGMCDISYTLNGNEMIAAFSKKSNRILTIAINLTIHVRNHDMMSHYCEVEIDLEEIRP